MASLTLNLSIGDLFSPLRSLYHSVLSKEQREEYIHTFDQFALRTMCVIILLATTVLTIMCVPYVIKIIETLIQSLHSVPKALSRNPKSLSSLINLTTMLPLLFLLLD
jgi:ABC-type phosphate transport system permease subunit